MVTSEQQIKKVLATTPSHLFYNLQSHLSYHAFLGQPWRLSLPRYHTGRDISLPGIEANADGPLRFDDGSSMREREGTSEISMSRAKRLLWDSVRTANMAFESTAVC